jgi:hypothetical protein
VTSIAFQSQPLPQRVAAALRARLRDAHNHQPFDVLDPRHDARRVVAIAEDLGLTPTIVRGGLDLDGTEIDHLWLDVEGRVIDVAFPLFVPSFVESLRRWVTGEIESAELAGAAADAGVEHRVLGEFPSPLRYRGQPIWSARAVH